MDARPTSDSSIIFGPRPIRERPFYPADTSTYPGPGEGGDDYFVGHCCSGTPSFNLLPDYTVRNEAMP